LTLTADESDFEEPPRQRSLFSSANDNPLEIFRNSGSLQPVNGNRPNLLAAAAVAAPPLPSTSLESVLITPSATWTTLLSTTSYQTTITQTESTPVPIIWRGSKIITTIYDTNTQVVTATEIKTSSVLVTPTPTWSTTTVTITPTAAASAATGGVGGVSIDLSRLGIKTLGNNRNQNLLEQATVLEIGKQTTPLEATRKLDTLKQAVLQQVLANPNGGGSLAAQAQNRLDALKQVYGSFFSDSARRSQQFNSGLLGRTPPSSLPSKTSSQRNPLFSDNHSSSDYVDDFDQQVLAAQAKPVFVPKPEALVQAPAPEDITVTHNVPSTTRSKVFTLFFSGKTPGDYSTKLTTLPVDSNGKPIRQKREAGDDDEQQEIQPSRVQPILATTPPHSTAAGSGNSESLIDVDLATLKQLLEEHDLLPSHDQNSLESSKASIVDQQLTPPDAATVTVTVTKTETLTLNCNSS